ncbi:MAG: transposase [bacterium]|nr:transposase [Candidatus Omnitrophota bacterium]
MLNRKRIYVEQLPYFITVNFFKRKPFFRYPGYTLLMLQVLKVQREQYFFKLYEYILMPDHYHIIISPAKDKNISNVMHHCNGMFAKLFNRKSGNKGQVFQHGFYDHGIRDLRDYQIKAQYIHMNPVRAGLALQPEQYPWSSARNRVLGDEGLIKLDDVDL